MSRFFEGIFEDSFLEDPNKTSNFDDSELIFDEVELPKKAKVITKDSDIEKIQTRMIVQPSGQIAEVEIHEMGNRVVDWVDEKIGDDSHAIDCNGSPEAVHKTNKNRRS